MVSPHQAAPPAERSGPPRRGRWRAVRRLVGAGASAGLAAVLIAGLAVDATAKPQHKISAEARRAGITAAGGGYAGWSMRARAESGGQPQQRSDQPNGQVTTQASSGGVAGIDVASYQGNVDWDRYWDKGKRFAYVKATEGLSYRNPYFSQQYGGSYRVGMIRGAYHFARPDTSWGRSQARYFVRHGGDWSADGQTLPGVIDLEGNYFNPRHRCWQNTKTQNRRWLNSFVDEYKKLTGRYPVIYSNRSFWNECVGNRGNFAANSPLWIAQWSGFDNPPEDVFGQWNYWTFWQFFGTGKMDLNRFSADMRQLRRLARG